MASKMYENIFNLTSNENMPLRQQQNIDQAGEHVKQYVHIPVIGGGMRK